MSIRLGKNTFIAGRVNTESLLDSPVFTGTPTTPTPNEGDNSKTVANTEFVQKELESKADSSTVYTKEEVDAKLGNVSVDLTDYYNKEEIDTKLENIDVLPDQTNNANKVLATNGTETSWQYTSIYRDLDNSTEVNSSQIVINTLSKETYNSMKEAGTLIDTELYMINDETPIPTKISELENDVGYLTSQVDISGKADKETTYTKEEVDTLFDNYIPDVSGKADITYVDEELELKADKETTYTKTEVDTLIETSVPNIQGGDYIDVVLPENITYYEYNGLDMPSLGKMSNNITISLNTFGGNNINLISDCTQVDTPVSEMYMLKLPESEVEYIQPLLKMDGTHYKLYEIISDTIYQAFGVTELTKENKNAVITQMVGTNVDVDCDTYILKAQFIDGNTNETRNILSTIYQDLNGDYIVGMYGLWDIEPINTFEVAPTDSSITIDWNDTAIKKIEDLETLTATIDTKADKETTYTKTEVDTLIENVSIDESKLVHTSGDEEISGVKTFVGDATQMVQMNLPGIIAQKDTLGMGGIMNVQMLPRESGMSITSLQNSEDLNSTPTIQLTDNKEFWNGGTRMSYGSESRLGEDVNTVTNIAKIELSNNRVDYENVGISGFRVITSNTDTSNTNDLIVATYKDGSAKAFLQGTNILNIPTDSNDGTLVTTQYLKTKTDGLTTTINTKADKSTTYTKTEVDAKVSSVYRFKGSVANYDALPTTDLVIGDVYNIELNGSNYAWDGNDWDKLSETIDLTPYLTKTEASTTYETIANVSSTKQELTNAINLKADKSTTYTKTEVDGLVSPKADKTYVDEQLDLKADKSTLATVATSGSYTDLSNTPVNVSAFLNDKNYVTVEELNTLGFLNQEQVDEIVTKNKTALTYWD